MDDRFFLTDGDRAFNWRRMPELQAVFALLNRDGEEVRVVGGAVRNSLLGAPVSDIDCATTAHPGTVVKWAAEAGVQAIPTGIEHGTVTLVIEGQSFEVTSLRADVETDGRHAEVAFGKNWQEDALRRDFTMNALYLDEGGRLYDPTGKGIADAKERRVRFIGQASQRIAEDYLRILRFFRFFAQYGRAFDQQDYFACVAAQKQLSTLSAERVGAEMVKLVTGRFAYGALEAMHKGGMLTSILGSVPHISRFARLQRLAKRLYMSPDINLLFAALAVDVREDAARLARVLRLPNRSRDHMMRMAQNVRTIRDVSEDLLQKLAYEHSKETACDLVLLAVVRRQLAPDLTDLSMQMRNLELWQMPVFPLNGRDLLDRGMKPGPNVGCRLAQLERAWVNSGFELSKRELLSKAYLRR